MKKLQLIILLAAMTLSGMAQTVGDAFYIYRNDGQFNAFFRDEVQSIEYSYEDADGNTYDEIVTQVVTTPDSVYKIPLAAIDSVGFVQPETKYQEGSIPLTGSLLDYLIKVEGRTLTFDVSLPYNMMPQAGDKIVTAEISNKLPYGFVGLVKQVSTNFEGIEVQCDSIGLDEAVSQFYGVYEIEVGDNSRLRVRSPHKVPTVTSNDYGLPFGRIHLSPIDLSAFVTEKNIFDINYKNSLDVTFTPQIHIKVTRVVDNLRLLSHTNINVVTDIDSEVGFDISGEASKEWKKSFLPKQDFIIPPCIPFYFDIGVKASLSGEIAAGFTINSHMHQVTDLTWYDVSLIPFVGTLISPIINRVDGSVDITSMDMNWDYIGLRAELKPCVYVRVGIPAISHVAGWVGGEFDGGAKLNGELMFDYNRLSGAEPGTAVYDELKDLAKIDIKPYVGAHFMAAAVDDRYSFRMGRDFENPKWTWYQGRIIPEFSATEAVPLSGGKAKVKANIINDCFIPYTVGFALYDEANNYVKTVLYNEKYWTRNAFSSYTCEIENLDVTKKYKVFPIIRFFGKYDMLASPSTDLDMRFPVTISDFKVTKSQYQKNGFSHNGQTYDYSFNTSVTVSLDDNTDNVADWGYVYEDPDGQKAEVSLKQFGTSYTDTRYAYYRNQTHSTARLYGYVRYNGSNENVYGTPTDYELSYAETTCPDSNHPHMIDLGLPSGTKWACCNVGATTPEGYGGYYAWGETSEKSVYNEVTYQYCTGTDSDGDGWYDSNRQYQNIGSDIAGTQYDVATVKWGSGWCLPSHAQQVELVNNTTSEWTTVNGINGRKFTGSNGGTIFLPAAGSRWDSDLDYVGSRGYYWSSSLDESDPNNAWYLRFSSGDVYSSSYGRYDGRSVRPVRKN